LEQENAINLIGYFASNITIFTPYMRGENKYT